MNSLNIFYDLHFVLNYLKHKTLIQLKEKRQNQAK